MAKQGSKTPANEPTPQPTQGQLIADAKDVAKWAAILYGCLSIFLLGAQTALVKLLTKPGELTDEAIGFYIDVFKQAAPLTLGMTLVGILWISWARSGGTDKLGDVFGLILFTGLILVVSMAVGNKLGIGTAVQQRELVGDIPMGIGVVINALYSYYQAYQGTLFFSSIAVAGLLTIVWALKIEPLIKPWLELKKSA